MKDLLPAKRTNTVPVKNTYRDKIAGEGLLAMPHFYAYLIYKTRAGPINTKLPGYPDGTPIRNNVGTKFYGQVI